MVVSLDLTGSFNDGITVEPFSGNRCLLLQRPPLESKSGGFHQEFFGEWVGFFEDRRNRCNSGRLKARSLNGIFYVKFPVRDQI